jgi:hypothetical protein
VSYPKGQPDNVGNNSPESARGIPPAPPSAPAAPFARPARRYHGRMPEVVAAAVPATVWPPPAYASGPEWLAWVRGRVRRSFLPPGGRWWDMASTLADPTRRAPSPLPPPFWAGLIDAPITPTAHARPLAGPTTAAECAGVGCEHGQRSPADAADAAAVSDASPQSVDVVFADLTDTGTDTGAGGARVDGRLGMIAAGVLCGGGILAVLTRCHPSAEGALVDASGDIVASAQDADLLYLQHIVIPDGPLLPRRRADAAPERPELDRPRAHVVVHADLLVFARPRAGTTEPQPSTAVRDDAASEVTVGGPSPVMAVAASSGVRR